MQYGYINVAENILRKFKGKTALMKSIWDLFKAQTVQNHPIFLFINQDHLYKMLELIMAHKGTFKIVY